MRLSNKMALITAAASGMGRAGCELFAREGATVFATDIDGARLDQAVSAIVAAGGKAHGAKADLLDPSACARVVEEAARVMGGLDIVWNHAGTPSMRGIEGMDLDDYARCMDLNLRAGMLVTAAALPHLRRRGGGSVVFTASIAGLVGLATSPVYNAAKSAVIGMAKSLSLRYARDRIRVNAVCPGPIDTPMYQEFLGTGLDAAARAQLQERSIAAVPMRRMGQPIEVAHAALWLASDDASYVTGAALPVDGGYTVA
jgi:NAD(P)-dependent dehydrogenase (short-subunit alcohol dehydrogenase family)